MFRRPSWYARQRLVAARRAAEDRTRLAERTGASPESILELVKLSDLSRRLGRGCFPTNELQD
jgi:hypothetical protein